MTEPWWWPPPRRYIKERVNQTRTKPSCNLFNIWDRSSFSWYSWIGLHPMRWMISWYLDQSEKRGCSLTLNKRWLIIFHFDISFKYLLNSNTLICQDICLSLLYISPWWPPPGSWWTLSSRREEEGSELKKLIRRVFCYRETDHARGNVCTVTSSPCTAECTSVHSLYSLLSSGQSIADNPQVNTDMCDS